MACCCFGGRIADYFGRKRTFLIGLLGFAGASALGGAAVNAGMLFAARGLQGAFGALLAPAALSLLTVTFTEAKERAKAFGVFGAISGGGAAIGLISGGVLTEYATLALVPAGEHPDRAHRVRGGSAARAGEQGAGQHPLRHPRRDPGHRRPDRSRVRLHQGGHRRPDHWSSPTTISWLAAAGVLLAAFVWWESRTSHPLLPLRVVLDRNRGTSYVVSILIGAGHARACSCS